MGWDQFHQLAKSKTPEDVPELLRRYQVSISPMFYKQLLHAQIPKAQKGTDDLTFGIFANKSCL